MKTNFSVSARFPVFISRFCPVSAPGLGSSEFREPLSPDSRNIFSGKLLRILNCAPYAAHFPCPMNTFHKTRAHYETARTYSAGAPPPATAVGEAFSVHAPLATTLSSHWSPPCRSPLHTERVRLSTPYPQAIPPRPAYPSDGEPAYNGCSGLQSLSTPSQSPTLQCLSLRLPAFATGTDPHRADPKAHRTQRNHGQACRLRLMSDRKLGSREQSEDIPAPWSLRQNQAAPRRSRRPSGSAHSLSQSGKKQSRILLGLSQSCAGRPGIRVTPVGDHRTQLRGRDDVGYPIARCCPHHFRSPIRICQRRCRVRLTGHSQAHRPHPSVQAVHPVQP